MPAERLREAMEAAKRLLAEEAASDPHTRRVHLHQEPSGESQPKRAAPVGEEVVPVPYVPDGGPPTIPYTPGPLRAATADVDCLRKDFPAISHWPEEMLRSQPVGDLAKANAELEYKMGRAGRPTLEVQLDNNYQQLLHTKTRVAAGEDNQISILHEARFLPGMLCSATDAWLRGRDTMPKGGLVPFAQYDVQNLGFSRNMSAKGWAALHNPGHGHLSVKMFATAAGRAASDRDRREEEPFSDLESFKTALRAASLAQTLVTPWNFSISAIEGFLHSTKYGFKFFRNQRDHLKHLTAFVDLCFEENARRWNLRKPFLVNTELTNEWNVFTASLMPPASAAFQHPGSKRGRSPGPRSRSPIRAKWAEGEDRTCSYFNRGSCRNREQECHDSAGVPLRHACSVRTGRNGEKCGRRHPAKFHPK